MHILQVDLAKRKQVQAFLDLPGRIYQDIQEWVPPMAGDERLRLDIKRYPFYRHSAAAFFMAYRGERPVGRLAVLDNRRYNEYNHTKDAFFYLFECDPDPQAAGGLSKYAVTCSTNLSAWASKSAASSRVAVLTVS